MTKIKTIAAAAAAAVCMGALSVTALAEAYWANFSLDMDGTHSENYVDVSNGVEKRYSWFTPATVKINSGNLSNTNRAEIAIVPNNNWPENYVLTAGGWKAVTSNNETCTLQYDVNSSNIALVRNNIVYLSGRTGEDEVYINGFWEP
ncbi:MAG: hypothetical protein J1F03_06950 [Oscillospiraceae bacterium]|nr:hypothetical protein [Oscillospiraceae bacterium]